MPKPENYSRLKEIAKELMSMIPADETSADDSSEDSSDPMDMNPHKPGEDGETVTDESLPANEQAEDASGSESDMAAKKKRKMQMIVSKISLKMGKKDA